MNYYLAALGGTALWLLLKKPSASSQAPAPGPTPEPAPPPAPAPTPPPAPNPFPPSQMTASIAAPSGLSLRTQPDEKSARLELLPFNSFVAILDNGGLAPATAAAPVGWFHVQSTGGKIGWASAEWVMFGTDKERGMTPEQEAEYHKRMSEREAPIFAGAASPWWERRRPRVGSRPARCLIPGGCKLRTSPSAAAPASAMVEQGATVQVLRQSDGWVLARYRDRHAPISPIFTGWLPLNALKF